MSEEKVAVVINGNNNLGLAIVKVLCINLKGTVYITVKSEEECFKVTENFKELGLLPKYLIVQTTDRESVRKTADYIRTKHNGFNILVNNTPELKLDKDYPSYEEAKEVTSQLYGSLALIEEYFLPLIRDGGRVVNISSAFGHHSILKNTKWIETLTNPDLTNENIDEIVKEYLESVKNNNFNKVWFKNEGKHADYKIAMVALTALTFVWQKKYCNRMISINAVNPGPAMHPEEAEQSVEVIRYLLFEASSKINGTFMWHNKKLVDWFDTENDYSCEM